MASGDTNVTICNQALTLLGSDTISSFSDTTNDAAAVCNNLYDTIKKKNFIIISMVFCISKRTT